MTYEEWWAENELKFHHNMFTLEEQVCAAWNANAKRAEKAERQRDELLVACKAFTQLIDRDDTFDFGELTEVFTVVSAAIAKVEGEK